MTKLPDIIKVKPVKQKTDDEIKNNSFKAVWGELESLISKMEKMEKVVPKEILVMTYPYIDMLKRKQQLEKELKRLGF